MDNNMDINNIMGQIEKIKNNMEKSQSQLKDLRVTGSDENGQVEVIFDGKGEVLDFKLNGDKLNEDLSYALVEATNDGFKKVKELQMEKRQEALGGIDMPDIPGII